MVNSSDESATSRTASSKSDLFAVHFDNPDTDSCSAAPGLTIPVRRNVSSKSKSKSPPMASINHRKVSSYECSTSSEQHLPMKNHWWKHWVGINNINGNDRATSPALSITASSFTKSSRAVWLGRIIFVSVLITVAAILGSLSFHFLTDDEMKFAETQFEYISQRAQVEAKEGMLARRWAGVTLAEVVGEFYPRANQWPFVEWLGFEHIAQSMLNTSRGNDMGFVPFVDPPQLPEFESFAKKTYQKLGFPNTTAVSNEFGFGVFGRNKTVNPPVKYHDTSGETPTYDSPYKIIAPIFRTDEGSHPVLLFNVHSQPFTGDAIDQLINCSDIREKKYRQSIDAEIQSNKDNSSTSTILTMPPDRCGVITDIFHNVKLGGLWSVANFLPIYPAQNPLTVVGYIPSIFIVHELLDNVFAKDISGIDAVFESDSRSISYTIIKGQSVYVGEGQHYDRKYEKLMQSKQLIDPELYVDGAEGVPKSFMFYLIPNDDFYKTYETNGPKVASVVVVMGIVLTMLAFLFYDFFVRKEFLAKRELLQARRQFMRFVSHEVRTPLNAVSMGLDLIQSEIAGALGYESATCVRAGEDVSLVSPLQQPKNELQRIEEGRTSSLTTKRSIVDQATSHDDSIPTIHSQKARDWFHLTHEIQVNAQGAVDILNDLLNYDKIEQGKLKLGLGVVSMWDLLEKSILEFKSPATSKRVDLCLTFGEDRKSQSISIYRAKDLPYNIRSLQVIGDAVRLTQVIRNLMSNALKFTKSEGSVHVKALYIPQLKPQSKDEDITLENKEVVSGAKAGEIKVVVEDTGAGMTPDQLGKLFQDGVQFNVNELQKGGGSGLGLYIAKGIVNQHSGSLLVTSDGIGQGTTFELSLPLWKLDSNSFDDDKKSDLHLSEKNLAPKSLSVMKILVVDDVMSNRKLLRRLLERCGHLCDEAENGKQCVEMISLASSSGNPYDSVLLDFEMPIMDGPAAAKAIRKQGLKVNIIGITGNVLPDDIKFFKSCGANDVRAKPVKIPDLNVSWMKFFSSRQEDISELSGSMANGDVGV